DGRGAGRQPHRLHPHLRRDLRRLHRGPHAHGGRRRARGAAAHELARDRARRAPGRMTMDLPFVFMVLMWASVLAYVVLDGYDLGVGMLMPAASGDEQSTMVSSIGPFWDANETWLVLGIGILLAAFPGALAFVLGGLYLPVVAMLVGLMLRGVAFELRMKAHGWHRELWNWLFWAGSFLASFCQGLMLGRYVTGFHGGFGYWLFAIVVGGSLCGGYVLLGATWLILKTEGAL